ncbi:hypothetical protein PQX77_002354, partial [Marasmius sp. AFHP31]
IVTAPSKRAGPSRKTPRAAVSTRHRTNSPAPSDAAWDALYDELKALSDSGARGFGDVARLLDSHITNAYTCGVPALLDLQGECHKLAVAVRDLQGEARSNADRIADATEKQSILFKEMLQTMKQIPRLGDYYFHIACVSRQRAHQSPYLTHAGVGQKDDFEHGELNFSEFVQSP